MSYNDIINAAYLYLDGLSLREIATKLGFSHVTIKANLDKNLKDLNYELWCEVKEKKEEKLNSDTIDDVNVQKRILLASKLLLDYDKTVLEIAQELNSTEFTIYRDLTKRIVLLSNKYPNLISIDTVHLVKNKLNEHKLNNLKPSTIDLLTKTFPFKQERLKFLIHSMLVFRLLPNTIEDTFKITNFKGQALDYNQGLKNSLEFLEIYPSNQDQALKEFLEYFEKVILATKTKDIKRRNELIAFISDKNFIEARNRKLKGEKNLVNDYTYFLKHQIKYAIPSNVMAIKLKATISVYRLHILKHIKDEKTLELLNQIDSDWKVRQGRIYG